MRKFVISDIHGFGNLYNSIMGYLDNISKNEEIELYINGDLIDRGYESAEILLDIKKRIEKNKYKITYLGGNHELMMYQEFEKRKKGICSYYNDWYMNGGFITDDGLYEILQTKEKILEVVDFVSNLKIYHKFSEKIGDKEIVLVHAACPLKILDECHLKIKDDNDEVFYSMWTREHETHSIFDLFEHIDPEVQKIGNKDYFTIIGHTPNNTNTGYSYHKNENYINIDGGVSAYVSGFFKVNHFPLVEICDGYLRILTFNDKNEIVCGNYFNGKSMPLSKNELNNDKELLDKSVKIKKLSRNEDGLISYWN